MKKAFTLIELMIVIAILAILASLISGNFITSLQKGRDAKRKGDLQQIQKALEMYYEDNREYPEAGGTVGELDLNGGTDLCHPDGCDTKIYMAKLPKDPTSKCAYYYVHKTALDSNGEGYELYSAIENTNDVGEGIKLTDEGVQDASGYGSNCNGTGSCNCIYKISSPNYP